MMGKITKQDLKKFIVENQLDELFEQIKLLPYADNEIENQIISMQSNFNKLNIDFNISEIISYDDHRMGINKIKVGLLQIVDSLNIEAGTKFVESLEKEIDLLKKEVQNVSIINTANRSIIENLLSNYSISSVARSRPCIAFLIGIGRFKYLKNLEDFFTNLVPPSSENDVEILRKSLKNRFLDKLIYTECIVDYEATRDKINDIPFKLINGKDDGLDVIIYFTGTTFAKNESNQLICFDTDDGFNNSIDLNDFIERLSFLNKNIWIILDSSVNPGSFNFEKIKDSSIGILFASEPKSKAYAMTFKDYGKKKQVEISKGITYAEKQKVGVLTYSIVKSMENFPTEMPVIFFSEIVKAFVSTEVAKFADRKISQNGFFWCGNKFNMIIPENKPIVKISTR